MPPREAQNQLNISIVGTLLGGFGAAGGTGWSNHNKGKVVAAALTNERTVFFSLQILLSLLLGFSVNSQAATLTVPAGYATIAAAITASANGDTITVSAGTYSENITISKNITIQSASGAASTIIQGATASTNLPVVTFTSAATLDGFTIHNQYSGGSLSRGIYINTDVAPTIQNCIITGNTVGAASDGAGIYITSTVATAAVQLINSTVSSNSARGKTGIWVLGKLDISGTTIDSNTASSVDGGGVYVDGGTVTINKSKIRGNSAGRNGGGVYVNAGTATITNSNITGNTAVTDGGGLRVFGGTLNIYNSTVAGNWAGATGGGGARVQTGTLNITNGIVWGNTSAGGAGILRSSGTVSINYSSYQAISGTCTSCANNRAVGEDPLLVNLQQAGSGAPTTAGDFHLQSGSSVIDQGTNNGYTPDIDGDSRPQGAGYDMGSDEYTGAAATVTLATGTDPGAASLAPGGAATNADAFSFQISSGTDVITAATVTLAAGTSGGLSLVEITNAAGTTVYGSVSDPASDTPAITLSTNTLTAATTLTEYRIRITPKTHANMPAPAGSTYSVTAYISNWTGTKTHAGSDTGGTTVTIDNLSPGNVTASTVTVGNTQVVLAWTNPADADLHSIVVLRRATSAVADVPVEGTTYVVGNTIGTATVACVVAAPTATCTDTGLTNGTAYHYKIFAKDTNGNYSATGVVPTGSPATPIAPLLTFLKTVAVTSDPVNSTTNPKYIPSAEALYTLRVTNSGAGTVDNNTLIITDPIPANTELFTGNLSGGAPFIFTNGTPTSGLNCAFIALNNLTDCMDFSNDNGTSWTYVPNGSFDPAVTNIRFSLSGAMNGTGGGNPDFDLSFRVRVK